MIRVSKEEYEQERTQDPDFAAFMVESGRVDIIEEQT